MPFYRFRQNNSGGDFTINEGVNVYVIVEALTPEAANARALSVGVYFDGLETGRDCSCCGSRWSPVYEDDGDDVPHLYGQPVKTVGYDTIIYLSDGRVLRGGDVYEAAPPEPEPPPRTFWEHLE